MANPLVSIICDVYNHGPYLRNALEGFVMQQVNFPIEILVHDDASTDNSAEIIREYETSYPDLFRPIYETENQYHKQHLWADIQFPRAKGKYIALCEGDDYWTDPHKLQKQVDYMESHPECVLCFHNAILHWDNGEQPDSVFASIYEKDYSGIELIQNWYCSTASILFKSSLKDDFSRLCKDHPLMKIADRPLVAHCSLFGTIHGIPDVMSVYSKHPGGYTQFDDAGRTYDHARTWEEIGFAFGPEFYQAVKKTFTSFYLSALIRATREKNVSILFKSLYRGIIRHPFTGISGLAKIPQERKLRLAEKSKQNNGRRPAKQD